MTLVINQPYFLPYIGLFDKIAYADLAIINEDAPISLCRKTHRKVKVILSPKDKTIHLITELIHKEDEGKKFSEIKLTEEFFLRIEEIIKGLQRTYGKAPGFDYLAPELFELMRDRKAPNLAIYNFNLIKLLADKLRIKTSIVLSNSLVLPEIDEETNRPTRSIYQFCKATGANKYLSGVSGVSFLDETYLKTKGINIIQHQLEFQKYPQFEFAKKEFIPGLSVVDLLFNNGPESLSYIGQNSKYVEN